MKRIAGGQKSEWRMAELKQLGRLPDSVVARRTGRTFSAVVAMRESLRLRLPTAPRRWTARETKLLGATRTPSWPGGSPAPKRTSGASVSSSTSRRCARAQERLLGKMSDVEVARRTGHPVDSVLAHRNDLGLDDPTRRRQWTPEEDRLLGAMPDAEIARRLSRTLSAVKRRRAILGLRDPTGRRLWTPDEDRLLGTKTDEELVRPLGRSLSGVKTRRHALGIPAFRDRRRSP